MSKFKGFLRNPSPFAISRRLFMSAVLMVRVSNATTMKTMRKTIAPMIMIAMLENESLVVRK